MNEDTVTNRSDDNDNAVDDDLQNGSDHGQEHEDANEIITEDDIQGCETDVEADVEADRVLDANICEDTAVVLAHASVSDWVSDIENLEDYNIDSIDTSSMAGQEAQEQEETEYTNQDVAEDEANDTRKQNSPQKLHFLRPPAHRRKVVTAVAEAFGRCAHTEVPHPPIGIATPQTTHSQTTALDDTIHTAPSQMTMVHETSEQKEEEPSEVPGAYASSAAGSYRRNRSVSFDRVGSWRSERSQPSQGPSDEGDRGPPVAVPIHLPFAEEFSEPQPTQQRRIVTKPPSSLWFKICGPFLLLVVLTVVFSFVEFNSDNPPPENETTKAPDQSTSVFIQSLLPNYSWNTIAADETSPQALAFQWVLDDPYLSNYPDRRIQQRFALATFYFATHGQNWGGNEGWLNYEVQDECQWQSFPYETAHNLLERYHSTDREIDQAQWQFFLTLQHDNPCDSIVVPTSAPSNNSFYRHLWHVGNNLRGTIPPEISMLTSLESMISVANMNVEGTLPTQLGLLSNLQLLLFRVDGLSGIIPSEIGRMTSLKALFFFQNSGLQGSIPSEFGELSQLLFTTFSGGSFSGEVPSEIGKMSSLQMLPLYINHFTRIPSEIGLLTNMIWLDLGNNNLVELPTEIGSMTSLLELGLYSNKFSIIPTELGQLTQLKLLHLQNNSLSGPFPSKLATLSHLKIFNLTQNDMLDGTIPNSVCKVVDFTCTTPLCGCFCGCSVLENGNTTKGIP